MANCHYTFEVVGNDVATANGAADSLMKNLSDSNCVIDVGRGKARDDTMDLGTIIQVVATSGAALALARGIAVWLRCRRAVTLTITVKSKSESLKVAVANIDPEAAERIIEIIRE